MNQAAVVQASGGMFLHSTNGPFELPSSADRVASSSNQNGTSFTTSGFSQPAQVGVIAQNGIGNAVDHPARPGIPQSLSVQAIHTLMSPDATPPERTSGLTAQSVVGSPEVGRLTEPRNYAPRTAGLPIFNEPPPRFNLNVAGIPPRVDNQDPFGPVQASNALIAMSNGPDSSAVPQTWSSRALVSVRQPVSHWSDKLKMLTGGNPNGLPTFGVAMAPDNFPFIEGAKRSCPVNHGVVKIHNVSLSPYSQNKPLIALRFPLLQSDPRLSLCLAVTARS